MTKFIRIIVLCGLFTACSDTTQSPPVDTVTMPERDTLLATAPVVSLERVVTGDILRRAKADVDYPLLQHLTQDEVEAWQANEAMAHDMPVSFSLVQELPWFQFIPKGRFHFGDSVGFGSEDEMPVLDIKVNKPFALTRTEITFEQWQFCVEDKACEVVPHTTADKPAAFLSYRMVLAQYLPWLRQKTGFSFRLPSEVEWEYAARAGVSSDYYWGSSARYDKANFGARTCCRGKVLGQDQWLQAAPVGSFGANSFGLLDVLGNISEWVEGCYQVYNEMFTKDCENEKLVVARGGSWYHTGKDIRVSNRSAYDPNEKLAYTGFRVLLELDETVMAFIRANTEKEAL